MKKLISIIFFMFIFFGCSRRENLENSIKERLCVVVEQTYCLCEFRNRGLLFSPMEFCLFDYTNRKKILNQNNQNGTN